MKDYNEADEILLKAKTLEETKRAYDMGANVNAKDRYREYTALMVAPTLEQTKFLREHGADLEARDFGGRTALMYPLTIEQKKYLILEGADVNAVDDDHRTVLMHAKTEEETELYLNSGARITEEDKIFHRYSALICAHTEGQAILLYKAGANLEDLNINPILSIEEKYRILKAVQREKTKSVDWLEVKQKTLKKRLKNNLGKTADVATGEVCEEHRQTAKTQVEISKAIMKAKRVKEGKE